MEQYYLAIDIGASSGRHMLCHMEQDRMVMEEIYRFPNGMTKKDGHLCWDTEQLFYEIKTGLKKCKETGKVPVSMGIDTWAVDFVLLDSEDKILGDCVGYRDGRTKGMDGKVYEAVPEEELYRRTGIQKQIFNTVYQLMSVKEKQPELMEKACSMLMVPDYFHFLLTGKKTIEYTNATTTQLVSPKTKDWDYELIDRLGYPKRIFTEIKTAGSFLGEFTKETQEEVGFNCKVVLPATHDTGSAVLAVPSLSEDTMYISSGTWSLMGVERKTADCSGKSRELNFTNEGGYAYRFRYLKNIMGLWMIQSLKKEWEDRFSFAELCEFAEQSGIESLVDCNDASFLAPDSMREAIRNYCAATGQNVPETPGDYARVVYRSLAECYRKTVTEIEGMTGQTYDRIHVVGGGSNAEYLNRLTAEATQKTVSAGPGEATAVGNLMVQMLSDGVWNSLQEARACVRASFDVKDYN